MNFIDWSSFGVMEYILLGLFVIVFATFVSLFFAAFKWHKASLYRRHDKEGMRRLLVYDTPIYSYVITLFLVTLLSIAGAFLLVGAFEGILWVLCWFLKILAVILIVVSWIAIVGGIIMTIAGALYGILIAIVGGLLLSFSKWLKEAMENAVEWCNDTLALVWERTGDVVSFGIDNYTTILLIVATPVFVTLAVALLIMLIDGICIGVEGIITHFYNVHRPCPSCGCTKSPNYIVGNQIHPVALHPGMYGIFYQKSPVTGEKLPTMLLNGRGKLECQCKECGQRYHVNGEHTFGTDIHIGIVGHRSSGKSYLLYSGLNALQVNLQNSLEQVDKNDDTDINNKMMRINQREGIQTQDADRYHAVQMMLSLKGRPVPYHLFFYDVAGEKFNAGSSSYKSAMDFYRNVNSIIFVIDPHMLDYEKLMCGPNFRNWVTDKENDSDERYDIEDSFSILSNVLETVGRKRKDIDFNFVCVKSDMGYLEACNLGTDETSLEGFVCGELGPVNIVNAARASFKSVGFFAASAISDDSMPLTNLFVKVLKQQGVNIKDVEEL